MAKQKHKHLIDVQTDEEIVTVTIGADGGVPGGFAKLFNRIVDSEAWARLSDAGRAAYIPLVRFADHRNQFRVQMGRAALMKYTGLSQSSIKRAMKDLAAHKLITLIEQGGVSASGENESNIYQLLIPTEGKRGPSPNSPPNPPSVHRRTPSLSACEPTLSPVAIPPPVRSRSAPGDHRGSIGGFVAGPQLRTTDKESSKTSSIPPSLNQRSQLVPTGDAAALLEEKGVEALVARQLAQVYPMDRIVDVIAAMEWRRERGKCDNPGGFIHDALVRQWQTPRAVLDARARAQAKLAAEEADRQARINAHREHLQLGDEEARIERLIASLEDDELAILAESILDKYRGNSAVTGVLTRKPPRDCRLMKMEIAAMLTSNAR